MGECEFLHRAGADLFGEAGLVADLGLKPRFSCQQTVNVHAQLPIVNAQTLIAHEQRAFAGLQMVFAHEQTTNVSEQMIVADEELAFADKETVIPSKEMEFPDQELINSDQQMGKNDAILPQGKVETGFPNGATADGVRELVWAKRQLCPTWVIW